MPRATRVASESDPLLGEASPSVHYSSDPALSASSPQRGRRRSPWGWPRSRATTCAACCAVYSCSSCLFMLWIGTYAAIGWDYMAHRWTQHERPTVEFNAFMAAVLYFATFLAAMYVWRWDDKALRSVEAEMIRARERDE
jgi:hypothetical protein